MGVTPEKRRFNVDNISHERIDADGSCSIEQFVAGKDDFRIAPGPKIPTPWPFEHRPPSKEFSSIVDDLETQIREILQAHEVSVHRISAQALNTKGIANVKDTLIILTFDDDPSSWKAAAHQVYAVLEDVVAHKVYEAVEYFQAPPPNQFRVEIRNERRMYRDTSSAIRANTDALQALMAVQPLVEEAIKTTCPNAWRSIGYHMRGPRDQEEDRKATVRVMIKPGTRFRWDLVEQKLDEALQSAETPIDITIHHELYSGYIWPA